jgi:hypothetical protein
MSLIYSDREIPPEQRLFRAVIANAAQEAAGIVRNYSAGPQRERIKQNSRTWFEHPSDDFRLICDLAGLPARDVRDRVLDYIKRVEANPANKAGGKPRGPVPGKPKRPPLADIARLAGVSKSYASVALNHPEQAAPATVARIHAAIKQLTDQANANLGIAQ